MKPTNKYLAILTTLLSLFSASSFAATECLFQDTINIDLKFQNQSITLDSSSWVIPTDNFTPVAELFSASPTSSVRSTCNSGQDGQLLTGNDEFGEDLNNYFIDDSGYQYLLYGTTTKGLYYGVRIQNAVCTELAGFIPPDRSFTQIARDVGDEQEKHCMKNDEDWLFAIRFFIDKEFKKPGTEATFNSSINGSHGSFRLSGSAGDVDDRRVTVKIVQINGILK